MRSFRAAVAAPLVVLAGVTAPATAQDSARPVVQLRDARLKFEINATDEDGGIQVFIDADAWTEMSIFNPQGRRLFVSTTRGSIREQGGTELFLESAEPPFTQLPIEELLQRFPEGEYRFRGRGLNGERLVGSWQLTHNLPDGPMLISPIDGAGLQDPEQTTLTWEGVEPPNGSPIIGYQVIVVQGDTGIPALPKIVLDVMMPPTTTSMEIPSGHLRPDTQYEWEVLAIEESGNQTISSSSFTTSPDSTIPSFEDLEPSDFASRVENPYFPRLPGAKWVYEGMTANGLRRTETEVLSETIEILGIQSTVVANRDFLDGVLTEDNRDYFAQDKDGNVWYLGENVDNYVDGVLHDHAGSWLGGDDGAIPGLVMLANPADNIGQTYRQEHFLGCTRDKAAVVSVSEQVTVPAGSFDNVLQTHDTSDVELDLDELKHYAPGIGLIKTIDQTTGDEFVLVEFS
jgi:Fibronectin type III domain